MDSTIRNIKKVVRRGFPAAASAYLLFMLVAHSCYGRPYAYNTVLHPLLVIVVVLLVSCPIGLLFNAIDKDA